MTIATVISGQRVLIYEKPDAHTLRSVRLGSHSELGFAARGSAAKPPPGVGGGLGWGNT